MVSKARRDASRRAAVVIEDVEGPWVESLTKEAMRQLVQPRAQDSHKGDYGRVLVVAGSPGKSGAAVLAGAAAATGIDVVGYLDGESDRAERLAPLLDILSSGRADTWCRATGTEIGPPVCAVPRRRNNRPIRRPATDAASVSDSRSVR